MFYIFEFDTIDGMTYLFTTVNWFSSNFDSLQQLCEVGLDDPDKEPIKYDPRIDKHDMFHDCKFLFQTRNLETAHLNFPEWFI